ncbi:MULTISPECIES: DUF3014 domain-containing protein [unclassified Anaeromyxobacter]|uniref:DUF3014 domain-containing protein n=1 Tax=unclassified Anaeromyxobacter TaxID=2620896 RepID=UPI001F5956B4|nr:MULTISPECIES: DUF3014 domain-containing protein [unclassified Anaeromyxobacter]
MDETPKTTLRRPSRAPLVVAILVVLGAAGFWASRRFGGRTEQTPPAAAPASPAGETSPAASPAAPPVRAADLGPNVSDPEARALADTVSQSELYRRTLAQGEVVRRAAVLLDNLAEGVSPRKQLDPLRPERPFSVQRRGAETVIDPASYARYDAFGDAIASVDAREAARVYRSLHGVLQLAYRALGYPEASLDDVTARALGRLAAAPVVEGDVPVVEREGVFLFQDERLETAPQVEKHLLRMGPRNTRIVQGKARQLLEALGMPVPPALDAPSPATR